MRERLFDLIYCAENHNHELDILEGYVIRSFLWHAFSGGCLQPLFRLRRLLKNQAVFVLTWSNIACTGWRLLCSLLSCLCHPCLPGVVMAFATQIKHNSEIRWVNVARNGIT